MTQNISELEFQHLCVPPPLRPMAFHGVELSHLYNWEYQARLCPYCTPCTESIFDEPYKAFGGFNANAKSGMYKCECGASGNPYSFLADLYRHSGNATGQEDLEELAERCGMDATDLKEIGLVRSFFTGLWILPGYNQENKISNLWQLWLIDRKTRGLVSTPYCKRWEPTENKAINRLASGGLYPSVKTAINIGAKPHMVRAYQPDAKRDAIVWFRENLDSTIREAVDAGFTQGTAARARGIVEQERGLKMQISTLQRNQRNKQKREELHDEKILRCLLDIGPATMNALSSHVELNQPTLKQAIKRLTERELVQPCKVQGTNNRRYDGYSLAK